MLLQLKLITFKTSEIIIFQQQYTQQNSSTQNFANMSIQKYLNTRSYLKNNNEVTPFQYRVRTLSKNKSMKQLKSINKSKLDVLSKLNPKYTADTSFFSKQNLNSIQIQSQQQLPKYSILHNKNQNPQPFKRNASHRILRKINSLQVLPQNIESIQNPCSLKDTMTKIQPRKVSLKRKVEFIKKKHNEDKSYVLDQQFQQVQSQQFLGEKKKSKPKLKLLVRDPFHSTKTVQRKKTELSLLQSKIQPSNDVSIISETNRQQFQQFLSVLN